MTGTRIVTSLRLGNTGFSRTSNYPDIRELFSLAISYLLPHAELKTIVDDFGDPKSDGFEQDLGEMDPGKYRASIKYASP